MLVLGFRTHERVHVGDNIVVTVLQCLPTRVLVKTKNGQQKIFNLPQNTKTEVAPNLQLIGILPKRSKVRLGFVVPNRVEIEREKSRTD